MSLNKHVTGSYGTMYYVRNMKKAVTLYKKKLGLSPATESPFWTEFNVKGSRLCLHIADKKMKKLPGGIMIINVKGMTKLVAALKKAGVKFNGNPHPVQGKDYTIDYYDSDKNLVSLYGPLK